MCILKKITRGKDKIPAVSYFLLLDPSIKGARVIKKMKAKAKAVLIDV